MRGTGSGSTPEWIVEVLQSEVNKSSQSEVSRAIGISDSMLHRYLRGVGQPTFSTMQKLVNYTGEAIVIELKPEPK